MIFISKNKFYFRVDKFLCLIGCFVDEAQLGIVTYFLLLGELNGALWFDIQINPCKYPGSKRPDQKK